jgi:hypothetical protein
MSIWPGSPQITTWVLDACARHEQFQIGEAGVLRFVQNDDGVVEGTPAHILKGHDLEAALGLPLIERLGRDLGADALDHRGQPGLHLGLDVAGQEADRVPCAGDGDAADDDLVDGALDQPLRGDAGREIGLAGAGRADREDAVAGRSTSM